MSDVPNVFEAPRASDDIPPEGFPQFAEIPGATFGIRAGGQIIDMLVHFMLATVGGVIAGIALAIMQATGMTDEGWAQRMGEVNAFGFIFGIITSTIYHTLSEGIMGASIGKLILGLRVVREDGRPCGLLPALIRSAAFVVDSFFFGIPAYNSMQESIRAQRYGDKWAHTVVVRKDEVPMASRASGATIFAGIVVSMGLTAVIVAVQSILHGK